MIDHSQPGICQVQCRRSSFAKTVFQRYLLISAASCLGAVPIAAISQENADKGDVQLILDENRKVLDSVEKLSDELGLSRGENVWADYQQQVESLESELGDVRGRLGLAERRMSENAALVDNLRSQHRERISLLQKKLLDDMAAIGTAPKQLAALEDQQAATDALMADIKKMDRATAALNAQVEQKNKVIKRQDVGLSRLNASNTGLQDSLAESVSANGQCNADLAAAGGENQRLRTEMVTLASNMERRSKIIVKQDKGIARLLGKIDKQQQDHESARAAMQGRIQELMADKSGLFKQQVAANAVSRELRKKHRHLGTALKAADDQAAELGQELDKANQQIARANAMNNSLNGQISAVEGRLDGARDRNRLLDEQLTQLGTEVNQRDQVIADLDAAKQQAAADMAQAQAMNASLAGQVNSAENLLDGTRERNKMLDEKLVQMEAHGAQQDKLITSLNSKVDDAERKHQAVSSELGTMISKNEGLDKRIDEMQARIAAPRQAAVALRDQVGRNLKEQGITNTVLGIRPDNSVTFQIANELLFESGSARLYKSGRTLLNQVAAALADTDEGVAVRVEGHTDSVPVAAEFQHIYPSNWYLSVARAAMAVQQMHGSTEMDPSRLSATGFGCHSNRIAELVPEVDLSLKMELLQVTGSFKPRGAVNTVLQLDEAALQAGITAFSAGNHAIAAAYAAKVCGTSAKVVMPTTANPYRVDGCRAYGAEVIQAETISRVVEVVEELQRSEGRALVHPFEGESTTLGTATVGLEICSDDKSLDAIVVPVGGGGLISGVALAAKHLLPGCKVYGVEPEGARGMSDSLARGKPLEKVSVNTIADSLGAPLHMPYSFSVVQQCVDDIVCVSDDELRAMMKVSFEELKLAVEPAGAASLAAIAGPLKERLKGQRVCALVCGSNIDPDTWFRLVA